MRGQDPWLADVAYADGPAVLDESHPPRVREAWSSSFRQEPPAALLPTPTPAPGARLLGRVLSALGLRNPRPLLVAAMLGAAILASRLGRRGLLAAAAVGLSPALAVGVALGTPDPPLLLALLATLALVRPTRIALALVVAVAILWLWSDGASSPGAPGGGRPAHLHAARSRPGPLRGTCWSAVRRRRGCSG